MRLVGCHQSLSHPEHKHVGAPHRYLERSLELTSKSLDGWLDFVHTEAWLFRHFTPLTAAEDSFNPTIYDFLLKDKREVLQISHRVQRVFSRQDWTRIVPHK